MTRRILAAVLTAAVMVASPAAAQTLGQGSDADIPWIRLGAALILCLGLAAGAVFALNRRLGGGRPVEDALAEALQRWSGRASAPRPAPRFERIETRRLTPQVVASAFDCDGRRFLVLASAQGQIELVSLDADEPGGET